MIKINKLPDSIVEIEGEIPAETFENYRSQAFKELAANLELPGFRKGHIPKEVAEKNIPEMNLLEKMAILALSDYYPKIIQENEIEAIGKPEITITKIAAKNPLGFKIKTAILPEWQTPPYREIAKKVPPGPEIIVTDSELKETIEDLRQMRATPEGQLPAYDDLFVKSLGKFENVADFENRLRENIKLEKEIKEKDKRRMNILKEILATTTIELPKIIIDYQLDLMLNQFKQDIERTGLKFEEYLKNINKTIADLRKGWEEVAKFRAKVELLLTRIATEEKLTPTNQEIEENISLLLSTIKEKVDLDNLRAYVINSLTKEKTLSFLENLAS